MQKEKEHTANTDQVEHTVTVVNDTFKIKLARGKKLSDLLKAIKDKYGDKIKDMNIEKCSIILNSRTVNLDSKIEDNPTLSRNSTITIMPRITGGQKYRY